MSQLVFEPVAAWSMIAFVIPDFEEALSAKQRIRVAEYIAGAPTRR
jgi:hypothetical protein